MIFNKKTRYGFTLVELLIVIAIIGVLSTIGVPTFRRMVQKAKKSEAKVALGGLFTAEAAFFSEYGGYGNNINKVGFELDGTRNIYGVGFTDATCANFAAANLLPAKATAGSIGDALNQQYPQFYSDPAPKTIMGRAAGTGWCLARNVNGPDGDTFQASASGAIAPGVQISDSANADTWQMDNLRVLTNVNDGVK